MSAAWKSRALSFLWLVLGAVLWAAYIPSTAVPVAAWLALVFLLRFSRRQKPLIGLPILAVTFVVIEILTNQGMGLIWPGASYYLWSAFAGLPWVLPFLADRLLVRHLPGFAATLVFPCFSCSFWFGDAPSRSVFDGGAAQRHSMRRSRAMAERTLLSVSSHRSHSSSARMANIPSAFS